MKYLKRPLTFEQQAELLLQRGLIAKRGDLIRKLRAVNYYRLSAYWYPFQLPNDKFKAQTNVKTIWQRYCFDRHLRLLVFKAIEPVEIAIRTRIVYEFVQHHHDPFSYLQREFVRNIPLKSYNRLKKNIQHATRQSREKFVAHFQQKYGDAHEQLPFWMLCEILSFGQVLTFYQGIERPLQQKIAGYFGISDTVFESWLRSINEVRNVCAHHGRLWNRELGCKPKIPRRRKHPAWHDPVSIESNRIFAICTILNYLLEKLDVLDGWPRELQDLLNQHQSIPRHPMGFPEKWQRSPLWQLNQS